MTGKLKYNWKSIREELPQQEGYYSGKNAKNLNRLEKVYYGAGNFYSSFDRFHKKAKTVTVTHWTDEVSA